MKTLSPADQKSLKDSKEKLTQLILANATGPMLAAGMSESSVVKMCLNVSEIYHEGVLVRYEDEL